MHSFGVVSVQAYSLNKGLKLFGQERKNTVQKEMQQHYDMETCYPVDPFKLTYERKKGDIDAMGNLAKKRCGRIKTRQCERGDMQKKFPTYKQDDVCSPTVHNDAVMTTSARPSYIRTIVSDPARLIESCSDEIVWTPHRGAGYD